MSTHVQRRIALKPVYTRIFGTGGIGTGVIYRLQGNHTLGRNESRPAHLLDSRDFCKLHIIFHYVSILVRDLGLGAQVLPVGGVGDDPGGGACLTEMKVAGMTLKYVRVFPGVPTLSSVCFQYPDDTGGNLTENAGASSKVTPCVIRSVEKELKRNKSRCIILAAPEVPFESRMKLVEMGRRYRAFNAASVVSEEAVAVRKHKVARHLDLLALNMDEAKAFANVSAHAGTQKAVESCIAEAMKTNPSVRLLISNGAYGAYAYEAGVLEYLPAIKVNVNNTAGAGDAALGAMIAGIAAGLPFLDKHQPSCFRLAQQVAAMSVTSKDTINFDFSLHSLRAFARKHKQKPLL